MPRTLSVTEVRAQFLELAEELNRPAATQTVTVTKRGKPVLALMPYDLYESLIETLDILGDATLMRALRRSVKEAQAGKTVAWDEVKRGLGL